MVLRFFAVLVVLYVTSLVSFTGSYTEDEPIKFANDVSLLVNIFASESNLCSYHASCIILA